jgi:hypothetical protein
MPTVDRLVLSSLSDRVFTEERVHKMLRELKDGRIHSRQDQQIFLKQLGTELEKNRQATDRLYEAVEAGLLPEDATLTERAHKLQVRRQEILTEMAGIQREAEMPEKMLSPQNVRAFCNAMRKRLADPGSGFGKQYLRLLVKEVQVTGKEIRMRGSYEALGHAMAKKDLGTPEGVPRFVPAWRAMHTRIRAPSAGCPDFSSHGGNLIVFLQNLKRKPLSVSWECPGTCGGSGEGVYGLPGGFQPHAISSSGGNPLWRK